jgi:hypothetical protein
MREQADRYFSSPFFMPALIDCHADAARGRFPAALRFWQIMRPEAALFVVPFATLLEFRRCNFVMTTAA